MYAYAYVGRSCAVKYRNLFKNRFELDNDKYYSIINSIKIL